MTNTEKKGLSRRDFLKAAGVTAAGVMVGAVAKSPAYAVSSGRVIGANDRINVGFVGVGGMGGNHLRICKNQAQELNTQILGVCDLWQKRLEGARNDAGLPAEKAYKDYQKLLEDKDIDVVWIATPEHWHAPVACDAMEAGKSVYIEKPLTRHLDEAFRIYDTAKRTGKVVQVGSQGCSDAKWAKAGELIKAGKIGHIVWSQGSYCRNNPKGEWNYGIDPEANPSNLDWKTWLGACPIRPWDPERYFRWRKYSDYSAGILSDLFPHRIQPLMIALGPEFPKRVACVGTKAITPDREVADNTQVLVEFPSGYTMVMAGSTVNEQGLQDIIRGNKATLYVGGRNIDIKPERPYADDIEPETVEITGPGESVEEHHKNFLQCVRTNGTPNCNIDIAVRAQTIVSLSELAWKQGKTMNFDPETRKII